MLKLVVLMSGAFFWTVRYGIIPGYGSARMLYDSNRIGMIAVVMLSVRAKLLTTIWLIKKYDVDPILVLLAIARANDTNFGVAEEPSWLLFNFEDRSV